MATFTVKSESVNDFITNYLAKDQRRYEGSNIGHLFGKELIMPINEKFTRYDQVVIELITTAMDQESKQVNSWTYTVGDYDSMNIILIKTDFDVKLIRDQNDIDESL